MKRNPRSRNHLEMQSPQWPSISRLHVPLFIWNRNPPGLGSTRLQGYSEAAARYLAWRGSIHAEESKSGIWLRNQKYPRLKTNHVFLHSLSFHNHTSRVNMLRLMHVSTRQPHCYSWPPSGVNLRGDLNFLHLSPGTAASRREFCDSRPNTRQHAGIWLPNRVCKRRYACNGFPEILPPSSSIRSFVRCWRLMDLFLFTASVSCLEVDAIYRSRLIWLTRVYFKVICFRVQGRSCVLETFWTFWNGLCPCNFTCASVRY